MSNNVNPLTMIAGADPDDPAEEATPAATALVRGDGPRPGADALDAQADSITEQSDIVSAGDDTPARDHRADGRSR